MDNLSPFEQAERQLQEDARRETEAAPLRSRGESPFEIAEREALALQRAAEHAASVDPDEVVANRQLSQATGVSTDAIPDHKEELQRSVEAQRLVREAEKGGPLLKRMAQDPEALAVFKDELPKLGALENTIAGFKSARANTRGLMQLWAADVDLKQLGQLEEFERRIAAGEPMVTAIERTYANMSPEERAVRREELKERASQAAIRAATHSRRAREITESLGGAIQRYNQAETFGEVIDAVTSSLADFGMITAYVTAQSLGVAPERLVPVAGQLIAPLSSTVTESLAAMQDLLVEQGVDVNNPDALFAALQNRELMEGIRVRGAIKGATIAAGDMFGIASGLSPMRPFASAAGDAVATRVAKKAANVAADVGAHVAIEGGQGAAFEVLGSLASGSDINPQEVVGELIGGGGMAAANRAGGMVLNQASAIAEQRAEAQRVREHVQKLIDAGAQIQSERDPETFHRFVTEAAAEGVQELYVDGAVLNQLVAQAGAEGEQLLSAMPEVARQMDEASFGTDVAIPIADLVTYLSKSKLGEALADHLRVSPNEASFAEIALRVEQLEQSAAEAGQDQDQQVWRESQQRVQDAVYEQIISTGNMGHEQARVNAVLTAAMFATQAGRMGVMPHELAARYQLNVLDEKTPTPIDQWNMLVRDFNAARDRGDQKAMRALQVQLQALQDQVNTLSQDMAPPQKTVKAYKLFRVDERQPGRLFPLFVDANTPAEVGRWLPAKAGEQKASGKVKSKIGDLAFRPGWHAGDLPLATHIGEKSDPSKTAPDLRPDNQVWAEVEMADDFDWQSEANRRGMNAKGEVVPVRAHITDQVPERGHYRYRTNPNMTGQWLIGGEMRINRILSDEEVAAINAAVGAADLPRRAPFDAKRFGFELAPFQPPVADAANPQEVPVPAALRQDYNMSFGERQRVTDEGYVTDADLALIDQAVPDRMDEAVAMVKAVRGEFPEFDGWAPLTLAGVGINEEGKLELTWQKIPYRFNVPPGRERAPAKHDPEWVEKVSGTFHRLVADIYSRADDGDKNAQVIVAQASWYRGVTEVLRRHYGAQGDLLSDLLGATSPNTPVNTNWRFAVDILRRFGRGDFREEMEKFVAYLDAGGRPSAYPDADKIRQIANPKGERKLYGMNSTSAMLALADAWRVIQPGSAPKARNFALNLIGQSDMATIDVWAARMLRRAANMLPGTDLPRIPRPAEQGVTGNWNASATEVTGEYGFGARVMDRVVEMLRTEGRDITAPDLQAVAWFAEKELWAQNKWTPKQGEGGSFEQEIAADPPQRWLAGWSIQQGERAPESGQVSAAQARVLGLLAGDDDVVAARVAPTVGLYGRIEELSFDTEWTVRKNGEHNPALVAAEIAKLAREHQQYDFFVSRVLDANESHPNARPGVEIYFTSQQALDNARQYLAKFTSRGQDGFTMAVDPRAKDGQYIGVRLQYVPEISARWDEGERSRLLADAQSVLQEKADALAEIAAEVEGMEGVAFADLFYYDTTVIGKESYDDFIGRATQTANRTLGGQGSVGERVAQAVARYRAAERAAADADVSAERESVGPARPGDDREGAGRAGFRARPQQADAATFVGIHYGKQAGLAALEGSRNGTGIKGAERERLQWAGDARIKRRVYFYPHTEGQPLPTPESGLGPHIYRQTLTNILPPGPRRQELWNASRRPNEYGIVDDGETANNFEAAVITAGYDGYMVDGGGGKAMIVVLDADVPVEMVERPAPPELKQEMPELTPAQREIERQLYEQIAADFEGAVATYRGLTGTAGGKILNTDEARELSDAYRNDRSQSAAVHEPASKFIKDLYARKLAEPKGPGGNVFFTAGGTGAGKTTGINNVPDLAALRDRSDIVYDTNMSKLGSAVDKIEQALASGRTVDIVYTYRDPVEALAGALQRAERMGRTVPIGEHLKTHVGSRQVIGQLMEKYADDERVTFTVLDNQDGRGVVPLDSIPDLSDNDLGQRLDAALEKEYEEGRIGLQTYRGFKGDEGAPAVTGDGGEASRMGEGPRSPGEGGPGEGQGLAQSARGTITFGRGLAQDGAFIRLLRGADASTFVHELGHFYLEMLTDMAAQPGAPAAVAQDLQIVLDWLGTDAQTWSNSSIEERRAQHEQFARGFEAYLFEGKAPIPELKGVFARFRAWMLQVYRSLADLNVTLTDEVRGVFDRMIANNDQLQEAAQGRAQAPVFSSAEEAGMTPEEWADYIATGEEATRDALNMMDRRRLRDMRWLARAKGAMLRKIQDEVAERRQAVEAEVRREIEAEPAALAARFIATGELPDTPHNAAQRDALDLLAGGKTKLSTEALRDIFGDGPAAPWRYLPPNMIAKEDGAHPDTVAEVFGFKSGDQMVRAILANDIEGRIAEETEARLLERYGDINSPEALENAVNEALANAAHQRFTATELATMQEALNARTQTGTTTVRRGARKGQTRSVSVNSILDAAKKYAEKVVARTKVRNLRPGKYTAAANRAATKAADLFKRGDIVGAIDAKRDQILNSRVAREAAQARDDVQVIVDRLQRLATNPPASIAVDYRDQIAAMLERFNLGRLTQKEVDRRKALAEWIEEQRELGVEPPISEEMANEAFRTHYTELTVEQLRDLDDAVKGIVHLGKLKQTLLTAKDQREYDAVMADMVASIEKHGGKPRPRQYTPTPTGKRYLRGFLANHRKLPSIIRQLDGVRAGGVLWERLIRPLNEAADLEATMREQSTVAVAKILAPLMKKRGGLAKKVHIGSIGESFTLEQRLAVALNMGNSGNRQRLQDGHGWSPGQVQAILNTLDRTDWQAVQAIWDHIDSYWPKIAEKTRRVGGTLPAKIEAEPFEVTLPDGNTMQMRGGYYPAAADAELSTRAGQHEEAEVATNMMRGAYSASMTRRGFLKERAKVATEPLTLALDPLFRHLNDVTHDLAFHEWLIDANRIRRDKRFADTVRRYYGPDYLQVINEAVHDIAVGDSVTMSAFEKVLLRLRTNVAGATMGFSITTAFMQPFGLAQSVVRIGPRWVLQGVAKSMLNPRTLLQTQKTIGANSEFMRLRAKTFNRELAELHGRVKKNGKVEAVFDAAKFLLMQKLQQLVDVPTWLGAYEKARFEGNDEARSIALADQAVIDSQGSGMVKDLARVQRGSALNRMMTIFYSYFSTTYNLTREQMAKRGKQVSEGAVLSAAIGAATDLAMLYVIPALGPALLFMLLKGEDPPEDEEEWLKWALKNLAGFGLGTIVGVRELSGMVEGYEYNGPAGFRLVSDIGKLGTQIQQGELDQGAVSAAIRTLGSATGLPSTQVDRTIRGWQEFMEGDAPPTSILFGPPPKN